MESTRAAETRPSPDAAEFVRFCYRRRAVGWPELYDEMCAVASRGLFRGWRSDELAQHGIGFGLFELAELAALTREIVAEEQSVRRSTAVAARAASRVAIDGDLAPAAGGPAASPSPGDGVPAPVLVPVPV